VQTFAKARAYLSKHLVFPPLFSQPSVVHFVEIIIALAVFATALIILITFNQGNIAPLPPGFTVS